MIFASWFNHIKYGASEILSHFADFFGAGVIHPSTDFALTYHSSMTVNVGAGVARVNGYRIFNDGLSPVALTFDAADATHGRIDLVQTAPVPEESVDIRLGTAQNLGRIYIKKGTPSGSPVEPTPDANAVPLYAVYIAAGQTTVGPSNVTDLRALVPFYFTALSTPMSFMGDMIYGAIGGAMARLPGNTSTTRKVLTQVGTGTAALEPEWKPLSDMALSLPPLNKIPSPTGPVDMVGQRILNLPEPNGSQEPATKNFVMGLANQFASQYAGVVMISTTTTMDGTYSKQLTILAGTSYTVILPPAATYSQGKNLSILSVASGNVTFQAAGADTIVPMGGTSLSSIVLGNGDSLTLVSNGSSQWYAVSGSVQYAGYAATLREAFEERIKVEPGMIMAFAGGAAPNGWLLCDGSAVSRVTYSALFAVIGTTYGSGNGSTTFNVPDARGRTLIGAGSGVGLTARSLGSTVGEETHVLSTAEMPSHAHTDSGHDHAVTFGNQIINTSGPVSYGGTGSTAGDVTNNTTYGSANIQATGGGGAHNNMQPSLAVSCIIKY